jgi:hypothetical protein
MNSFVAVFAFAFAAAVGVNACPPWPIEHLDSHVAVSNV